MVALAGCGSVGGGAVAPDAPLADECGAVPPGARRVTFQGSDGADLGAAAVGRPAAVRSVVLVHGGSQTLCDWLDIAVTLAERADAEVLLPDRRGAGSSSQAQTDAADLPDDVLRAAAWFAPRGRSGVTYAGSSAGAPVALAAAARAQDVCSIALVSPASVPDVPAGTLERLDVALWTVVEAGTPRFRDTARALARLAPAAAALGGQTEITGTTDHSSGLVENHPAALDVLVAATRACG
ncbi:alpha/beta fold hydrolase [Kineosporia sp. A_224]|uniref:alpha/beta fold hydrolase n=1 Tax=Kineosporia sp. A_224 TaxID=1962180 RepID=UPI0013042A56|nr:alpha/beta hydrolase [Kineosporia sp. A_224]